MFFLSFFFVYSFWLFLDISGHKTSNVGKLNMKKGDNVKVYELSSLLVIVWPLIGMARSVIMKAIYK